MITRIDAKNKDLYFKLFQDAKNILLEAEENGISLEDILPPNVEGAEQFEIATLNQYFGYLDQLVKLAADENIKSYLLRLPLDEGLFEIDANTRNIKIPTNFSRYGVGVQGDETAEIVYFSIDRYFDHIDLANTDMNIVIQWETKDENRQTITGISPSFGRDVATDPTKVIFGWPIYSDLTKAPGTIKFAVRFYTLGQPDEETSIAPIIYSLTTLPSEVSIGATLDYKVATEDKTGPDADWIRSRIQQSGIYDDSFPVPGEPTISTPLKAFRNDIEIDSKVVDLSDDGNIVLKVGALPSDFGAIQYIWHKQNYNDGQYDELDHNTLNGLSGAEIDYREVTGPLTENVYYRITRDADDTTTPPKAARYSVVLVEDTLEDGKNTSYTENKGYKVKDSIGFNTYYKLYEKYSTITVEETGIYTVDIRARSGPNSTDLQMESEDGIKIPGPLKPTVEEHAATGEDNIIHIIEENGKAILVTNAHQTEDDSANVSITYNWKKVNNDDTYTDIIADTVKMPVSVLPVEQLPEDPEWLENASENGIDGAKGIYNQEHVQIVQVGNLVKIYLKDTEELKRFESTNPAQGNHAWVALDIDTGADHVINNVTWQGDTLEEENELGVADGHIVYWFKADEAPATRTIQVSGQEEVSLTFRVLTGTPSTEEYSFVNEDKNQMVIQNLPTFGLDESYIAEITAERNKVKTTTQSKVYRITEAPKVPVIKRYVSVGNQIQLKESDYLSEEQQPIPVHRTNRSGDPTTISIIVDESSLHSDENGLSYSWMKADIQPDEWIEGTDTPIIQIDFERDTPINVFTPSLTISNNMEPGYYYCLVTNKLNNHTAWNASPYYELVD